MSDTDDLEKRLHQHEHDTIPGFTADHRPVTLIWSEACDTREDARAFELRLKGWSKAKKLALVRGDWNHISRLAQNRQTKEGQAFDRLRQTDSEVRPS